MKKDTQTMEELIKENEEQKKELVSLFNENKTNEKKVASLTKKLESSKVETNEVIIGCNEVEGIYAKGKSALFLEAVAKGVASYVPNADKLLTMLVGNMNANKGTSTAIIQIDIGFRNNLRELGDYQSSTWGLKKDTYTAPKKNR